MPIPTLELGSVYGTPVLMLRTTDTVAKKVYAGSYSGHDSTWRFPAFYPFHRIVYRSLKEHFPALQVPEHVRLHLQRQEHVPTLPDDFRFITPPFDHQKLGMLHLYRCLRAGLFYSPGLGKCKITVDLQRLTQDKLLVLCPRVMLQSWKEEFQKHGEIDDVIVLRGTKEEKLALIQEAVARPPVATVTTYATAALYAEQILKIGYNCIVADESHQLKTYNSKRTLAATALAQRAYRRVLLSGTPSLGSPYDLYPQLKFLAKYLTPETWWAFRKKFGVFYAWEENEAIPKTVLGYKNFELINKRCQLVALRRTKEECLDLPERQIIDVPFDVEDDQRSTYNQLVETRQLLKGARVREQLLAGKLTVADGPELDEYLICDETITLLNKLDQMGSGFVHLTKKNPGICNNCGNVETCSFADIKPYTRECKVVQKDPPAPVHRVKKNARLDALKDLLETILQDPDNKVIVWANFIQELNDIESVVKECAVEYVRLQGGLSHAEMDRAVSSFGSKGDGSVRACIGQVSTGVGITLNSANYTVYYNLPWSLEHYLQSLDRNYRIGQKRKVVVYRLIGRHTLDESKSKALDQKIDFSRLVTASSVCATCEDYYSRCHRFNIKLYDDACKFERAMMRETATVRRIP